MNVNSRPSRNDALRILVTAPAALATLASGTAMAQAKAPKSAVHYQDSPKNGQQCSGCRFFIASGSGNGQCQIVQGAISPKGWCSSFAPKS
jgi:hypothetical protein